MNLRRVLSGTFSWSYFAAIYAFIFLPVAVLVLFSFQDGRLPIPPFNGVTLKWYGEATAFQRILLTAPLTVSYLIIALGLLVLFNWLGVRLSLWTVGIGHVVINLPLCFAIIYASMGEHQRNIERAAQDLGANSIQVVLLVTAPMLMPSILAAFFLSLTFSWDEFIISFLLSRFDVTLPVEIWSLLRSGLNPKTNAIGSIVFLMSTVLLVVLEMFVFRPRSQK